jgi:hypothetical protein
MEHLKTPFEYELCCPHDTKGDRKCLSGIFDFIFTEMIGFATELQIGGENGF